MKQILSIDLDFLFKESNLYKDKGNHALDPETHWAVLEAEFGKDFLPLDEKALLWLDEVVDHCVTDNTTKYFIDEHDEIMPILFKECADAAGTCVNIDYHHDIDYGGDGRLNIGNWVTHAVNEDLILEYVWIGQPVSERCTTVLLGEHAGSYIWNDIDPKSLPKADVVVFCLSKHFTPPRWWGVFKREYSYGTK